MTWKLVGETCRDVGCNRPVFEDGFCRPHYDLATAFGYRGEEPDIVILDHQSHEFGIELNRWRSEAA